MEDGTVKLEKEQLESSRQSQPNLA
jgi:hypothetical protein